MTNETVDFDVPDRLARLTREAREAREAIDRAHCSVSTAERIAAHDAWEAARSAEAAYWRAIDEA